MSLNVAREVAALQRLTVPQLRQRYAEVFGETTNANHRGWLVKRIAWRLQAVAEGDLSERARRRAAELANDADLRLNPPRDAALVAAADQPEAEPATLKFQTDNRLPPPGTVLTRPYKGKVVQVMVLANGFDHDGKVYPSLSAVARAVTGCHCNGFLFFRLAGKGGALLADLEVERRVLEKDLARLHSGLRTSAPIGDGREPDGAALAWVADAQERVRAGEQKLVQIKEQMLALRQRRLDEADVAAVLEQFGPVWEDLTPREQARLVRLLVERVDYDGVKGSVAITFHAIGIRTLADELAGGRDDEQQERRA